MSKATIQTGGKSITGDEVSRQDHTASDLLTIALTGGLAPSSATPDTVTVRTDDGKTRTGRESK